MALTGGIDRHTGSLRLAGMALRLAAKCAPMALALVTAAQLAIGILPAAAVWFTKQMIDALAGPSPVTALRPACLLALTGFATAAITYADRFLKAQMQREMALAAQARLYSSMERLRGLSELEQPSFQDKLRLAQQAAETTLAQVVTDLLALACGLLGVSAFLAALVSLNATMALLIILAGIPVLVVETRMARRRASVLIGLSPVERREFFYATLLSSLEAAKEVRLFGIAGFLRGRMIADRTHGNMSRRRQEVTELRAQLLLGGLAAVVSGVGLYWAATAVTTGALTIGDLALFIGAVAAVQQTLTSSAMTVARMHHQLLIFASYTSLSFDPDSVAPEAVRPPVPPLQRGIEFRDVWFRYGPDQEWILRGVSLFVPVGQTIALAGRNGSGKSTLVKMLCRFYDPERGAVLWDGVDIRQFDIDSLRSRLTVVFQDFMRYDLSAAENIGVGNIAALQDSEAIAHAATESGIDATLRALPAGYATLLTRLFNQDGTQLSGVPLSGGQWQRVALARALLRSRRDVMILDEPSAGLDPLAEQEVHETVSRIRQGSASILISHRLGALRNADVIAVLDRGQISELGTHDELMDHDGDYAKMFLVQAQGYQPAVHIGGTG